MSSIAACDSDEEVFWGPVTAKEIELLWRYRMAERYQMDSKMMEEECHDSTGCKDQLQEVPSLQDFRKLNKNEKKLLQEKKQCSDSVKLFHVENILPEEQNVYISENNIDQDHFDCEQNQFENGVDICAENGFNEINDTKGVLTELNNSNEHSPVCLKEEFLSTGQGCITEFNDIKTEINGENSTECSISEKKSDTGVESNESDSKVNDDMGSASQCDKINVYESCDHVINGEYISSEQQNEYSACLKYVKIIEQESNEGFYSPDNIDHKEAYVITTCDHLKNHDVHQEVPLEHHNHSLVSSEAVVNHDDKLNNQNSNADGDNESSDEKSFVSLSDEENNIISSSNQQSNDECVSSNQDGPLPSNVKNKENEDPSIFQRKVNSKIPITNPHKPPVLKPARLQIGPGVDDAKWACNFQKKKIPNPRKPDYMVSPAKLGTILKNRSQPTSTPINKTPVAKAPSAPKVIPSLPKPKLETPLTKFSSSRKKNFGYVQSPISQYIRTGTGITQAKSLPALRTPNKIPVPLSLKQPPVHELTPKFYSSAERLVIKPGPSSSAQKTKENEPKTFLTPKIFKHQGRIPDKVCGEINVVSPRAVRTTNLQDASFVALSQPSKQLNVSVLEEQ